MASARLEEIIEKHTLSSTAWRELEAHSEKMRDTHLRKLFASNPTRGERMRAQAAGVFLEV
jgi:glucose-6-phosphate isomerase